MCLGMKRVHALRNFRRVNIHEIQVDISIHLRLRDSWTGLETWLARYIYIISNPILSVSGLFKWV